MVGEAELPDWWRDGVPVVNVYRRSGDAEFIFDDDDLPWADMAWRDCAVPITAFGELARPEGEAQDECRERCAAIEQWAAGFSNIERALIASPVLATLSAAGDLVLQDGLHRLMVAKAQGCLSVPVVCAVEPSVGR